MNFLLQKLQKLEEKVMPKTKCVTFDNFLINAISAKAE